MLLLQLLQGRMCDCVCMIRILLTIPSIVATLHLFDIIFSALEALLFPGPAYRTEILDCHL